jgi:hypothetical protein
MKLTVTNRQVGIIACLLWIVLMNTTVSFAQVTPPQSAVSVSANTAAWEDRLAGQYYDYRETRTIMGERLSDAEGYFYFFRTLQEARGIKKQGGSGEHLFVSMYSPVWKPRVAAAPYQRNKLEKSEWDLRAARIRYLTPAIKKQWQAVFNVLNEGTTIGELWTIGILVDIHPLFTKDGLDTAQAELFFKRLKLIPLESALAMGKILNLNAAWSATLVIQNDDFFTNEGFVRSAFDASIERMKAKLPAPKK